LCHCFLNVHKILLLWNSSLVVIRVMTFLNVASESSFSFWMAEVTPFSSLRPMKSPMIYVFWTWDLDDTTMIVVVYGIWLVLIRLLLMVKPHWERGGDTCTNSEDQVNKRCSWEVFKIRYCIPKVGFYRPYIWKN
jgi:hypothetical protein